MSARTLFLHARGVEIRLEAKRVLVRGRMLKVTDTTFSLPDPGNLLLNPGDVVDATVSLAKGVVEFKTELQGRGLDPERALVFRLPENAELKQRREYVRVPARVPVSLTYPPRIGVPQTAGWVTARGVTLDISAGGMKAIVEVATPPVPPQLKTDGMAKVFLWTDQAPIQCRFRVLRVDMGQGGRECSFCARFIGISFADEARIMKYARAHETASERAGGGSR